VRANSCDQSGHGRKLLLFGVLLLFGSTITAQGGGVGHSAERRIHAVEVLSGLNRPAAFTIDPDGRIIFGERLTGEIRISEGPGLPGHLLFTVPKVVGGKLTTQGLLGLALHPHYPEKAFIYAYVTRRIHGSLKNQIVRITDRQGSGGDLKVIYSARGGVTNQGGRILFGPDGLLYAVVGEMHRPELSQDLDSMNGKVLRMTPTGRVPRGNPFRRSLVFARGIRNSYGFDFDPVTGLIWETDNGPECNDELNLIRRRGNYGWGPHATCERPPSAPRNTNRDGRHPVQPERFYTPTIAPTGLAFCAPCGLGEDRVGDLFFGSFNTGDVREVTLGSRRRGVVSQTVAFHHRRPVLSMETGPRGAIFFSDSQGIFRLSVG
jgi:glucose/arabinose dehydrogenase